ncbi:MAG: retropepsin-like domain-containing protein, partial [Planctomycetes bacterium]|nr:retropepsin-like domain-containing protein [Planctomycetota bacterium]
MRFLPAVLLAACAGNGANQDLENAAFFGNTIRLALAEGDFDRAVEDSRRGLERFPDSSVILAWNALVAQMQWQESRALALLRKLREGDDYAGIEYAELQGRIGDLLFRTGSYSDSIPFLNAAGDGPQAARRSALVELARELPYERLQPGRLVAELPLLEGSLPTLLCSVADRQRPFVLDTGASMTALTRSLATELGVAPVVEAGTAVDGTGRELPVALGVLHALSLGTVRLDSQPVLVVDDSALSLKDPFGGPMQAPKAVVGLDVLARFRVTFDPTRQSVLFELSRGLDEPRAVGCVQFDGRCLVPVRVEGRR